MKIELKLRDFIFVAALIAILMFTWMNIVQLRSEVKFSQNFTAIVNQLNTNTNDIKAIAQAVQVVQQKVGIIPQSK